MEDSNIVELYWQRSEDAVPETSRKYGGYCHAIAYNILENNEDTEECVNDTWLGAWNSMPENRPARLAPYLAKMTRWLSLTRLKEKNRLKRGGGEAALVFEEMSEYLDSGMDVERIIEQRELSELLDRFLSYLGEKERAVFLARYWFMLSVNEIAAKFGFSQSKVKTMLMRSRRKLQNRLKEEWQC